VAIDLHLGVFGVDGPDNAPVGRIGDRDITAVQTLVRMLGLEVKIAPTTDFVLSASEVKAAVLEIEGALREFESNGSSARSDGVRDLCIAIRQAASESKGLSCFGD
jgi:hypothetical protein